MYKEMVFLICGFAALAVLYSFSPAWGWAMAALSLALLLVNRAGRLQELLGKGGGK